MARMREEGEKEEVGVVVWCGTLANRWTQQLAELNLAWWSRRCMSESFDSFEGGGAFGLRLCFLFRFFLGV